MKPVIRDPEEGSATAEIVIIAPLLMLLATFVIGIGRITQAQLLAQTAAGSAARAASLARTPQQAVAAAHAAVDTGSNTSCPNPAISVDTSAFHPGGTVAVSVRCRPRFADLTGVGFPGSVTIDERIVSSIDAWRQAGGS